MGIKGAILGDIAGSMFEQHYMSEAIAALRESGDYELYNDKSTFTDDTVTSLAIKKAMLTDKDFEKALVEVCQNHRFCGFGRSFYDWVFLDNDMDPEVWSLLHPGEKQLTIREPYNSWGNGSAMRVSFVGEYLKNVYERSIVEEWAKKSAEVTHNHPEGIKGAQVIAVCVWMAERGVSKEEIYDYAQLKYPKMVYQYGIDRPISEYKESMTFKVSCMDSVPVAIRCFYETNSFEECMRLINSMKCDADTIGAMAGSICESYYGCCFSKEKDMEIIEQYLTDDLLKILNMV